MGDSPAPNDWRLAMASATTSARRLKPLEIAEMFGVKTTKVLHWIKTGQLRAVNIHHEPNGEKPRYMIAQDDLRAFEAARSAVANTPPSPAPRRRTSATNGVRKYF